MQYMLYTMGLTIVADIQIQYSSSESESVFFSVLAMLQHAICKVTNVIKYME